MLIARLHQGSADTTARKSAFSQNPAQIARLLLEDPLEIPPFPLPPNDAPVTRRLDVHRIGSPGLPLMTSTSGVPFYGPNAVFHGKDIVQVEVLSDRRVESGGIAWLNKWSPPPGKLIKIVATAFSDEHVLNLAGAARAPGGYTLNPGGQRHSAFIASETINLVIHRGEPDEIVSLEVVDVDALPTRSQESRFR